MPIPDAQAGQEPTITLPPDAEEAQRYLRALVAIHCRGGSVELADEAWSAYSAFLAEVDRRPR